MLLEVDFEGVKYWWTGTVWVDQRFIRVPALLVNRLARLVAKDGLVLPAMTGEEWQSRRRRGSDRRGALDYELSRDNHLLLSMNLSRAWREYQHGWGAIIQGRLSLIGVKSLLIRFKAFSPEPAPRSFQDELAVNGGGIAVSFIGTRIRMDIPLLDLSGERFNPALGWSQSKQGNAFSVWKSQIDTQRMSLLLVISPPNSLPEPTYFDWHRRFWPGGLPGSNRRH